LQCAVVQGPREDASHVELTHGLLGHACCDELVEGPLQSIHAVEHAGVICATAAAIAWEQARAHDIGHHQDSDDDNDEARGAESKPGHTSSCGDAPCRGLGAKRNNRAKVRGGRNEGAIGIFGDPELLAGHDAGPCEQRQVADNLVRGRSAGLGSVAKLDVTDRRCTDVGEPPRLPAQGSPTLPYAIDPSEPPWVRWRLGLLDSNQGLVGQLGSVGGLEFGGWDVAEGFV
jgi:hypothetical protein